MRILKFINLFITWCAKGLGLQNLMIVRCIVGGKWYKQCMSGELPGCYGCWWTRHPLKPSPFHYTEKIEDWNDPL